MKLGEVRILWLVQSDEEVAPLTCSVVGCTTVANKVYSTLDVNAPICLRCEVIARRMLAEGRRGWRYIAEAIDIEINGGVPA